MGNFIVNIPREVLSVTSMGGSLWNSVIQKSQTFERKLVDIKNYHEREESELGNFNQAVKYGLKFFEHFNGAFNVTNTIK